MHRVLGCGLGALAGFCAGNRWEVLALGVHHYGALCLHVLLVESAMLLHQLLRNRGDWLSTVEPGNLFFEVIIFHFKKLNFPFEAKYDLFFCVHL